MNVMGVYLGHDLGACILRNGEIAVMIEEERLNRYKHGRPNSVAGLWPQFSGKFGYFPWASVSYCLHGAGLGIDDLDLIAVGDDIWGSGTADVIAEVLPVKDRRKIVFARTPENSVHHFHHALSAFFASPFEKAAVLVIDGDGSESAGGYEAESGYYFENRRGDHEVIFKNRYTEAHVPRGGIGWTYEHVTQLIGFASPDIYLADAGKTMGLAGYGEAVEEFAGPWIRAKGFELDFSAFHQWLESHAYADLIASEKRRKLIPSRFAKNLAHKAQRELEGAILELARELHRRTGAVSLCLAGGVALNSVANGRILREGRFESVFVQPAANDAGQALGLAYHAHLMMQNRPGREFDGEGIKPMRSAFTGAPYPEAEIEQFLQSCGLPLERCDSESELVADAAKQLADGRIVGWFQGGSEVGPRALGHRSILAHPGLPKMKDHLNRQVKFREPFRPFAPAVLRERANDVFELLGDSPYMTFVAPVRREWRTRLPAITHVDGTARLQTVDQDTNSRLYELIRHFEKITGLPVVVNTSFNLRGMPIVETPKDALQCFMFTEIDRLYLGNYIVERPPFQSIQLGWGDGWRLMHVFRPGVQEPEIVVEQVRTGKRERVGVDRDVGRVLRAIRGKGSLADMVLEALAGQPDSVMPGVWPIIAKLLRLGALSLRLGEIEFKLPYEERHFWHFPRPESGGWEQMESPPASPVVTPWARKTS